MDDFTDNDIRPSESVCPGCRLVFPTTAFSWGVCGDCLGEGRAPLYLPNPNGA